MREQGRVRARSCCSFEPFVQHRLASCRHRAAAAHLTTCDDLCCYRQRRLELQVVLTVQCLVLVVGYTQGQQEQVFAALMLHMVASATALLAIAGDTATAAHPLVSRHILLKRNKHGNWMRWDDCKRWQCRKSAITLVHKAKLRGATAEAESVQCHIPAVQLTTSLHMQDRAKRSAEDSSSARTQRPNRAANLSSYWCVYEPRRAVISASIGSSLCAMTQPKLTSDLQQNLKRISNRFINISSA